jgi:hypothetical protein
VPCLVLGVAADGASSDGSGQQQTPARNAKEGGLSHVLTWVRDILISDNLSLMMRTSTTRAMRRESMKKGWG